MDSETDTDTHSLYGSETSRENYKSPESSDCEGYATPLASSLTDIAGTINNGITINVPDDADLLDESAVESGERTPVSTSRAISPPIVKQVMYLQKPRILVMTHREIPDDSSEEEFYDVDDVQIRDIAQQLLNGVSPLEEERADTPILDMNSEVPVGIEDVSSEEDDERLTPIQMMEEEKENKEMVDEAETEDNAEETVQEITENIVSQVEITKNEENFVCGSEPEVSISYEELLIAPEEKNQELETEEVLEEVRQVDVTPDDKDLSSVPRTEIKTEKLISETKPESSAIVKAETPVKKEHECHIEETTTNVNMTIDEPCVVTPDEDVEATNDALAEISQIVDTIVTSENNLDKYADKNANSVIEICVQNTQTFELAEKIAVPSENVEQCEITLNCSEHGAPLSGKIDAPVEYEQTVADIASKANAEDSKIREEVQKSSQDLQMPMNSTSTPAEFDGQEQTETHKNECEKLDESQPDDISKETSVLVEEIQSMTKATPILAENQNTEFAEIRPTEIYEEMPEVFSEITLAKTPLADEVIPTEKLQLQVTHNQETIKNEPMPTVVNSDEVKTSLTTDYNDVFSDCSTHEVKVDFDGYSSGKEESLSSSTSTESFEFAEPVSSNHIQDEKTQALRNSIIERYPSNETDDDELDSVGDEFDEDLLAVKQISAEVEQLVAAINAFGRDEEQQMSAYLVGKKMAAEKKRKSAMDTGVVTSSGHDQTVQTDNDSFILVDRHFPEAMESLQVEIDRLQADLEQVKSGEKELLKINSKLKEELEESQQTIDGIEVEAEQQYTELTSEIDELCDVVLKKDQELAALKEKVANLTVSEGNFKDDVDSQRIIVQRQKEIIESLREELDAITKKLGEVTKLRDKAIEEATIYKMKNMERDRFLSREAQMSMEIEDLQRELNKQKLILNQTSMAKLADTFDRKVLHLENELRERDMLICKQNQIINSHRKSPTGSVITHRKMQPRASVLAAAGNLPSAGSSSESFQNGLDVEAKEALLSFILSDRHNQLANIYNIGRILDLSPQEERAVERHLTKDRFT